MAEERRYRVLIAALLAALMIHVLAPAAMVGILQPGLDVNAAVGARAAWVAGHPGWWRLGWVPWQLSAASDLWLSVALVRYLSRVPGRRGFGWALGALAATLAAVLPDQWAEALEVTRAVAEARATVADPAHAGAYLAFEAHLLLLTGTCATTLYALMGFLWTAAVAAASGGLRRNGAFVAFGSVVWLAFLGAVAFNTFAVTHATLAGGYPRFGVTAAFNTAGFALLTPFLIAFGLVLRRAHRARVRGGRSGLQ